VEFKVAYTFSSIEWMARQLLLSLRTITRYVDPGEIVIFATPPRLREQVEYLRRRGFDVREEPPFLDSRNYPSKYRGRPFGYINKLYACTVDSPNVIFLDNDTVVKGDVTELLKGEYDVMAMVDPFKKGFGARNFETLRIPYSPAYDTGFILYRNWSHRRILPTWKSYVEMELKGQLEVPASYPGEIRLVEFHGFQITIGNLRRKGLKVKALPKGVSGFGSKGGKYVRHMFHRNIALDIEGKLLTEEDREVLRPHLSTDVDVLNLAHQFPPIVNYTPTGDYIRMMMDDEYRFLHRWIQRLRPKTVVETGTAFGMSGRVIKMASPETLLVTIDLVPGGRPHYPHDDEEWGLLLPSEKVVKVKGDARKVLPGVLSKYKPEVVFHDDGHQYDVISTNLKQCYSAKVPWLIVHDHMRQPGIRKALEECSNLYRRVDGIDVGLGILTLERTPPLKRWRGHVERNMREGRHWYHGLPYRWWWGKSMENFLKALPGHLDPEKEPKWF